jgi:hypothetical protein
MNDRSARKEPLYTITIPVMDLQELNNYQKGIIELLARVHLEECTSHQLENIKAIYSLLSHLTIKNDFLLKD